MRVLGVSCHYHDAAAALLVDGELVAAAQEERFSRVKHDARFPRSAIRFCLRRAGIEAGDLDYVAFYEKPLLKLERILLSGLRAWPRSWRALGEATLAWADEKLWIKDALQEELGLPADRVLFAEHHVAHAASALFCSPWERAALLTVDGVGEWTTTASGTGTADWSGGGASAIALDREIRFPHSLGLLYSAFTAWLGFQVNEGEYKVMGMAAYGEPRYEDRVRRLIHVEADGSFALEPGFFAFPWSPDRMYGRAFVRLFGPARDPAAPFFTRATHPDAPAGAALERNQYCADVAASVQRVTEDVLVRLAADLRRRTGLPRLCLAGGVALNAVANGRILRESGFDELFVQPAAGDAGGAVGAALWAYHVALGQPRRHVMEHAYLGEEYGDGEVRDACAAAGARVEEVGDEARLAERVAGHLAAGRVVGWAQGRFEWGPRALGNRSILADPRRAEMKDVVNRRVKHREPFRPFAPVVPEECAGELFDLPDPGRHYPARFMLLVVPWREAARGTAPAVDHAGTARVQTLRREWNPRLRAVLDAFAGETGVPVLLNTSFNLRGEPIVSSPAEALDTFRRGELDVLVFGNQVVSRDGRDA